MDTSSLLLRHNTSQGTANAQVHVAATQHPQVTQQGAGGKDQTGFVPEVLAPPGTQATSPCQNNVALEFPSCKTTSLWDFLHVLFFQHTQTPRLACLYVQEMPIHQHTRCVQQAAKLNNHGAEQATCLGFFGREQTFQRWMDDRTHSSVQFSCPLTGTTEKSMKMGIIFRLNF